MRIESNQKVTAEQLKRKAYLYIRQSSLKQVIENTESTKRQYALRQRAVTRPSPVGKKPRTVNFSFRSFLYNLIEFLFNFLFGAIVLFLLNLEFIVL